MRKNGRRFRQQFHATGKVACNLSRRFTPDCEGNIKFAIGFQGNNQVVPIRRTFDGISAQRINMTQGVVQNIFGAKPSRAI
jgi:hypothetical protein